MPGEESDKRGARVDDEERDTTGVEGECNMGVHKSTGGIDTGDRDTTGVEGNRDT
jgi:hypothetical protein